jgi:ATP-dependent DNA ligase
MAKLWPAMKTALRRLISSVTTAPTAFDLIERNGDDDLRRVPPEVRKTTLASIVAKAGPGIRFNEHIEGDGDSAMPASSALKALCQSARIPPTAPAARPIGLR